MKRILMVAMLAVGGLLGVTATASADVGDVNFLSVNDQLFGTASTVEVTGQVRCQATVDYGLIAAVAQNREGNTGFDNNQTFGAGNGSYSSGPAGPNASAEGVGAFGPNFDPPVGISDDNPCSQSLRSYDIVVQQNRDSGDFFDGTVAVVLTAASSAESGDRGPGPFIGDYLQLFEDPSFDRTR